MSKGMVPEVFSRRSNVDPFVRDAGGPLDLELVIPTGEGAGVVVLPLSFAAVVSVSRDMTAFVARRWQANYRAAGEVTRDQETTETKS